MTFTEIKDYLSARGKPVSDVQLYRYLRSCEIEARQPLTKPRNYPENAGGLIAEWLGLPGTFYANEGRRQAAAATKLASLAQLRSARKSRKARAAR